MEQSDQSDTKIDLDELNDQKFLFLLEEYKMLRAEIESYSKQKRQLELSVITALIAAYGWLAISKIEEDLKKLALIMPIIIVIIGIFRLIFYVKAIDEEVKYVREEIEKKVMGEKGGWEVKWKEQETIKYLRISEWIFWFTLTVTTLIMPYFYFN